MVYVTPANWRPQGIADLEPRAWKALRETDRSVCVTAGAGAGKTEFLAQKATYLLQTGLCPAPQRILAISFKRDAARNLADRVAARCPPEQARRFVSMTFDAFTKHLLDHFGAAIPADLRPPADYEITFLTSDQLRNFLRNVDAPNVDPDRLDRAVAGTSLPLDTAGLKPRTLQILQAFWTAMYEEFDQCQLTFPMINRLVGLALRTNPMLRRALRSTYPIVLLDEFQDTTTPQYDLLQQIFDMRQTIFTAVGDDKQKIMGWAGAMDGAFNTFAKDTNAKRISLLCNWRSHAELVQIQHIIAARIDPQVEPADARGRRIVDGHISAIWVSRTREEEVTALADWIAAEIAAGLPAHDIAILARKRVDRVEKALASALAERGIALRNLARNLGAIALQDLLAEELTTILLAFLRLGAKRRDPAAWALAQESLLRLETSLDADDERAQRKVADRVVAIAATLRQAMSTAPVSPVGAKAIVSLLGDEIGLGALRRASFSYQREAEFTRVVDGINMLLTESTAEAGTWSEALDRFEGIDQIALMTVHKSKGLEFHTMIFFGLDNSSWASLKPGADEELNAFFVAFTRAAQRAFFTCCEERGGEIEWLQELLGNAVPKIPFP
ncbi:UvrD-helicase domain-containing protein [Novosphingobium sp. ZW T3_23]|uniref:UvrD-helicase domain-containing protein n=1 Tax=Novosphingobium sp. ZW T3_23 TaxID=3378084 RepID=UPI003852FC51